MPRQPAAKRTARPRDQPPWPRGRPGAALSVRASVAGPRRRWSAAWTLGAFLCALLERRADADRNLALHRCPYRPGFCAHHGRRGAQEARDGVQHVTPLSCNPGEFGVFKVDVSIRRCDGAVRHMQADPCGEQLGIELGAGAVVAGPAGPLTAASAAVRASRARGQGAGKRQGSLPGPAVVKISAAMILRSSGEGLWSGRARGACTFPVRPLLALFLCRSPVTILTSTPKRKNFVTGLRWSQFSAAWRVPPSAGEYVTSRRQLRCHQIRSPGWNAAKRFTLVPSLPSVARWRMRALCLSGRTEAGRAYGCGSKAGSAVLPVLRVVVPGLNKHMGGVPFLPESRSCPSASCRSSRRGCRSSRSCGLPTT